MTAPTPAKLRLDGHCLIVLERTLRAASPAEGCALLLGTRHNACLSLQRVWPCSNCWEPVEERPRRFRIDPREQLLAQRWCRERGLQVLGAAHSHPSSEAVPSATDLQLCLGPTLMLIHSGLSEGLAALRAWWIQDADTAGAPLELTLEASPAATGAGDLGE